MRRDKSWGLVAIVGGAAPPEKQALMGCLSIAGQGAAAGIPGEGLGPGGGADCCQPGGKQQTRPPLFTGVT